jgi:hypothetical protein
MVTTDADVRSENVASHRAVCPAGRCGGETPGGEWSRTRDGWDEPVSNKEVIQ